MSSDSPLPNLCGRDQLKQMDRYRSENRARLASSVPPEATALHTLPFLDNLPFFRDFPTDVYFVRPRFPDYYNYIASAFDSGRRCGVTVTGPPRVGTSVFLVYFLHRYQLQHPEYKFVLICNDIGSKTYEPALWGNGVLEKELELDDMITEVTDDPNVIFLLDGTPEPLPPITHRCLVCTRMDDDWNEKTEFKSGYETIYLPLWDANELTAAVRAVGLEGTLPPITAAEGFPRRDGESEVEYRFRVFGGIASPCFRADTNIVDRYVTSLRQEVLGADLKTSFRPQSSDHNHGRVSHVVFHGYPSTQRSLRGVKIASSYVTKLMSDRLDAIPKAFREDLNYAATMFPAAATLHQSIVASRMLRQLQRGVQLAAKPLTHPPQSPHYCLLACGF